MEEIIADLIESGIESSSLDFKEKMYPKSGTPDLLKDILAMANSSYLGKRYIIMGVKDRVGEERIVSGISQDDVIDAASYQQFILNNIEPDIHFDLNYIDYQNKKIAVIVMDDTTEKPYLTKKQYKGINQGLCLIRKGSINSIANKYDFDKIYELKSGAFEVRILDNQLRAVRPDEGTALLDVSFRNRTTNSVTLIAGKLLLIDSRNKIRSTHSVYGFEKEVGSDFRLEVSPKKEITGDLHIGFGSNDALLLDLDEYGYTDERFKFTLQFIDSWNNEYSVTVTDGIVFARGDFLWKVTLKNK